MLIRRFFNKILKFEILNLCIQSNIENNFLILIHNSNTQHTLSPNFINKNIFTTFIHFYRFSTIFLVLNI